VAVKRGPGILLGEAVQPESAEFIGAEGGTRTRTGLAPQRILSPLCLPFHHPGTSHSAALTPLRILAAIRLVHHSNPAATNADNRSCRRWGQAHEFNLTFLGGLQRADVR
jgi:hypothetical protein